MAPYQGDATNLSLHLLRWRTGVAVNTETPSHTVSRPSKNSADNHESPSPSAPGSGNIRLALLALLALVAAIWIAFPRESPVENEEEPAQTSYTADREGLTGRVVDTTGRPIQEAVVETGGDLVQTDADGRFTFDHIGPGTHELTAHADGHVRAGLDDSLTVEIGPESSSKEAVLVLSRAASIEGRVVAAGDSVEDAVISLSYLHSEGIDGSSLDPWVDADVAHTDADGRFTLNSIPPGRLKLLVEADDAYAESEELYLRPGGSADDVYVDLAPSGVLHGSVLDDTGAPVDAEITLESSYADQPSHHLTTRDGTFSIDALPEGYYSIQISAEGFLLQTIDDVFVTADEPRTIEIALQRSQGLVGRVIEPDGTPVADAQVTIRSTDGEVTDSDSTDEEGRFQWRQITSGDWTVVASSKAHDPTERTRITPGNEIAIEVVPGGNLIGRVLDHRRRPVTEFTISAHALDIRGDDHRHLRNLPELEISDRRGRFDIGPIRSGRYRFVVESPNHPPAVTEDIEIEAGQTEGPLTIQLDAGATIGGTITDLHTGAPVADAVVYDPFVTDTDDAAVTDDFGSFELTGLPNSLRALRIEHDEYHTEIFHGVDPSAATYHFDLTAADDDRRTIRGQVGVILGPGDRGPTIVAILPDTPADFSFLEEGDTITGVDGVPTDEMTLEETLQRIRGYDDTPVHLDIHRGGLGNRSVTVDRERTFTH